MLLATSFSATGADGVPTLYENELSNPITEISPLSISDPGTLENTIQDPLNAIKQASAGLFGCGPIYTE